MISAHAIYALIARVLQRCHRLTQIVLDYLISIGAQVMDTFLTALGVIALCVVFVYLFVIEPRRKTND
jgi:hypothetical protein